MYSYTFYHDKQYYNANYQMERFVESYPESEKAEEIAFMAAKSYYHLSPRYSRDQSDTKTALEKLQIFINQYPETEFLADGFDPIIAGVEQSATNFNVDLGFSYHLIDFYAHATVKNVLSNEGINFNEQGLSYDNLRTYIFSAGNTFSKYNSDWSFEPSMMFLYRDATEEASIDINAKAYKKMDFGKVWGGLSYRRSLDGAEFLDGSGISSQKLQYFTPFVGVDYNSFVFAYTYSYQANSVVFNNGGFHQITLGYNFNTRKEKYECNCPAIN